MAKIEDVITYIYAQYPNPLELSPSKLLKIMYLIDWRSALVRGIQVTDLQWRVDENGPSCDIEPRPVSSSEWWWPMLNREKRSRIHPLIDRWFARRSSGWGSLNADDKAVIDFVLRTAASKHFGEFTQLVYSTYPLQRNDRSRARLDLVGLAKEYGSRRTELSSTH
jgi:hypothetical protein